MSTPSNSAGRRETRLLLVTIAISVGVLLLLARFRFPDEPADRPVSAAPAPLERLAARATYDELASIMADLERRIAPRVWIVRTTAAEGEPGLLLAAPRLTPDRAVVLVREGDTLSSAVPDTPTETVARDDMRGLAVVRVPALDDGAVPVWMGTPRPGPRYLGVVEATPQGPTLRPVYVGRMQLAADARTGAEQLSLTALQHALTRGSAVFTLDGSFLGLVRDTGSTTTVIRAEFLRAAADGAQPPLSQPRASLGIDVEPLTAPLARGTGADRGVVVAWVDPSGPAAKVLQSGDVLQSIDGDAVTTAAGFRQEEATRAPGGSVALAGVRRGSPLETTVIAADASAATVAAAPDDGPGIVARAVPGAGLELVTVRPRGAAALAGLAAGDLIVAIDGQPDPDNADLMRRYRAVQQGRSLLVTVQRGSRHQVLALEKR